MVMALQEASQVWAHPQAGQLLTLVSKVGGVLGEVVEDAVFGSEPGANGLDNGDYQDGNGSVTAHFGTDLGALTPFRVNVLLGELVAPHSLRNLGAAVLEVLNLVGEGVVDVDRDRIGIRSMDSLVEVSRHAGDQSNEVGQSQDKLFLDILRDGE